MNRVVTLGLNWEELLLSWAGGRNERRGKKKEKCLEEERS